MNKLTGLGRGLGSLIPMNQTASAVPQGSVRMAPLSSITVNPRQPRRHFSPSELEDLMASIKEHGLLQPLVVQETTRGQFELIAGERRFRAVKMLGLHEVAVVVRLANDQEKLELALIENIQRQDLNALEEARAFHALVDEFHLKQDEVAKRVGKSRSLIANTMRLLELTEEMQEALAEGKISKSHARTLLAQGDVTKREHLFHQMLNGGMTVREAEARASAPKMRAVVNKKSPNILAHEARLREILGTKVDIQDKNGRGKISVSYFSKEELMELLARLTG
ncbi:MAG: ParB/RepB/Spo0J family partition protein [Patescibacteria group bacterium]